MPWYVLKRRRVFIDFKNQEVKRLRGVICTRYSCNKQREESIEGQIRECKEFARTNRIDIINTYIDRAMSATNDNRPQFQKMISDSYLDCFDVVLIWKSDRFSKTRSRRFPIGTSSAKTGWSFFLRQSPISKDLLESYSNLWTTDTTNTMFWNEDVDRFASQHHIIIADEY